ncbi:hypothetical protein B0J14DRAFT_577850 [Halenospora varia]|nr:hypothetical protein B0J14DRAFT_577850 [Halenospora varia]
MSSNVWRRGGHHAAPSTLSTSSESRAYTQQGAPLQPTSTFADRDSETSKPVSAPKWGDSMLGRQTTSTEPTSNRAKESQSSNPFAALDTESPKPVGAPKWERSKLSSGQIAPAKNSTSNAAEEEVDDEEKEKTAIKAKAALSEFPSLAEAKTLSISIATLV